MCLGGCSERTELSSAQIPVGRRPLIACAMEEAGWASQEEPVTVPTFLAADRTGNPLFPLVRTWARRTSLGNYCLVILP